MRPTKPGTYYFYLQDVLEGDYIKAGDRFSGPMYFSKVIGIEWASENHIRVLTERGEYFGHPMSTPCVKMKETKPRDKSGK